MKMMEPPDLDADMRSVIDAARSGHEPSEIARARVRRGVEVKLAAGLALAIAPTASAFASAVKVTATVVAIGTAVGAGVYVYPRFTAKPAAVRPPATHVAARPARIEPPAPVEIEAPAPAIEPPAPKVYAKHRAPVAAAPVVVENVSSLKEETALLGAANAALAHGEVKRALSLLDDYDHRPGAAQLAEERTVTGILASCAAGHVDAARAEARHFQARWPRSPLAARVDGSCAGSGSAASGPARSVP